MRKNRIFTFFFILFTVATALVSCNRKTVYDHYEHTPLTGWEKNDTLIYRMPAFKESGTYSEELGLRISDTYPFTSICIIVDQTVIPKDRDMGQRHDNVQPIRLRRKHQGQRCQPFPIWQSFQ